MSATHVFQRITSPPRHSLLIPCECCSLLFRFHIILVVDLLNSENYPLHRVPESVVLREDVTLTNAGLPDCQNAGVSKSETFWSWRGNFEVRKPLRLLKRPTMAPSQKCMRGLIARGRR